jgi:glycosyltransferase involved in cell wall biosynthesis
MRILLACAAFPPFVNGGGAITSFLHAKALVSAGHEVRCVSVQGGDDRFEEYEGLEVHRLRSRNIYWNYYEPRPEWKKVIWHGLENFNPIAYLTMHREIKDFHPDIVATVSTENINVATWAAARAEDVPVAHCAHSFFLLCWRGSMFKADTNCRRQCIECKLTSFGKKALSQLVHGFHAESGFVLDVHRAHGYFRNAATQVTRPAIDGIHHRKRSAMKCLRIGFIGAHTPNKGIETLASAAQLCAGKNVEFIIAGSGDHAYSAHLRSRFPSEMTRFTGWIDQPTFFNEVDVIVVPSIWQEPFGRVVIEAFSYGVPVVATSTGGLPESVKDDFDGYLFSPGDQHQLANILCHLADDPITVTRLSENAMNAATLYLQDIVGRTLTGFYLKTIERGRQRW